MEEFNIDLIRAKYLKNAFDLLCAKSEIPLKIIREIRRAGDFQATQDDIIDRIGRQATGNIFQALVKCGIIQESNIKGALSERIGKGRGLKKYYKVNIDILKMIQDFVEMYPDPDSNYRTD